MTPKQARFVAEYVKDLNATQAAIRAGYSARTANKTGPALLVNPGVQAAIAGRTQAVLERAEIDAVRVLEELARLATSDLADCFGEDGRLLPIKQIPRAARAAIAGMKVTKRNLTAGDGIMDDVIEVKLWDKGRALDTLAKHFGLLVDASINVNVNASLEQVAGVLQAARKRHAAALEGQ